MLIYTHAITARCMYVLDLIFKGLLLMDYTVTNNLLHYNTYSKEKLAYTFQEPGSGFFIESGTLLFENGVRNKEADVFSFAGTHAFFKTRAGNFPFDIFAASFYLVSRYEEHLLFQPDKYGRFQAKDSLAYKHHFLGTPVVNYWVQELKKSLSGYYPSLSFQDGSFTSVTSFDVDVAYAFQGRSFLRSTLALLNNLVSAKPKTFVKRIKVIAGIEQDPYDTYGHLQEVLSSYHTKTLFFFLLKDTVTRFDRNLSPSSAKLRLLIKHISSWSDVGIHPSYYSTEEPALLRCEKEKLEMISCRPVTKSRQHYLRFVLPDTYIHLAEAGITDDYSMGYAEIPGFRAGICTPFYFYNLKENVATSLRIHPVAYMDGSFIEDLHMRPEDSIETIRLLISKVKEVKGNFLCIWHNHTISDYGEYKGWRQVLQQTLQIINE